MVLPPDLPRSGRLDVVCLRPIHHILEYEALFRLMAAIRERAPALEVVLHLRSALCNDAPFARLPVRSVRRLTERGGRGELAAGLRRIIRDWEPGAPALVLAAPLGFRGPGCGDDEDCAAAGRQFLAALCRETPLWRVAPGAPPPLDRDASCLRFLIHQARFHIGDVLWLTPLLRALHQIFRRPLVTLVGSPVAATVLAGNPHLAELVVYHPRDGEEGRRRVLAALAGRSFDAALFGWARRSESRWLMQAMAAAGVPRRINLEYHDAFLDSRETWQMATHEGWFFWGTMPSPRLLLHALDPLLRPAQDPSLSYAAWDSHVAHPSLPRPLSPIALPPTGREGRAKKGGLAGSWLFSLFSRSGGGRWEKRAGVMRGALGERLDETLELHLSEAAQQRAEELLADIGFSSRPFAVLSPGGLSSRRWPAASFARLAVALAEELDLGVLIEGSPEEAPLLLEVEAALGAGHPSIHVRQDPLDVFAALLARARLAVSNDSAPLHFAAALGLPALYFAQREKLVHSRPASPRCVALWDAQENDLTRISVEQALGAVREILTRQLPSPTRQ